jgi:hypothetical protein
MAGKTSKDQEGRSEADAEPAPENGADKPSARPRKKPEPGKRSPSDFAHRRIRNARTPETLSQTAIAEVLQRTVSGQSRATVAEAVGITRTGVHEIISKFKGVFTALDQVPDFRAVKAELLDAGQLTLLHSMMDKQKLADASLYQVAQAFDILYKACRLEQGKSTSNQAVAYWAPASE